MSGVSSACGTCESKTKKIKMSSALNSEKLPVTRPMDRSSPSCYAMIVFGFPLLNLFFCDGVFFCHVNHLKTWMDVETVFSCV